MQKWKCQLRFQMNLHHFRLLICSFDVITLFFIQSRDARVSLEWGATPFKIHTPPVVDFTTGGVWISRGEYSNGFTCVVWEVLTVWWYKLQHNPSFILVKSLSLHMWFSDWFLPQEHLEVLNELINLKFALPLFL